VMLMDEPFSAVDPVVREQLQNEFLRLQSELSKTIVFVTHDIDEAIKLGDQVAVMRVGGKLAQLATPADLLSNPLDDFVAGFVGRDRGYRALGFEPVSGLQLEPETTVRIGSDVSAAVAIARDGWVLVVDEHDSPQGWLAVGDDATRASQQITPPLLHRGGTVASLTSTFRSVLDAALSSPTGRGVIIDEGGRFAGTITAANVVRLLEQQQRVGQQPVGQQPVGQQPVEQQPVQQPSAGVAPR
jgi:osmoprotectant transport system ATP-binding protein